MRETLGERAERPVLVTAEQPEPDLTKVLLDAGCPCLVFVDSFEETVRASIDDFGVPPRNAIGFATYAMGTLAPILAVGQTRVFGPQWRDRKTSELVGEIAAACLGSP